MRYTRLVLYSIAAFLVFPVGIPVFYYVLLYRYRREIYPGNAHKILSVKDKILTGQVLSCDVSGSVFPVVCTVSTERTYGMTLRTLAFTFAV